MSKVVKLSSVMEREEKLKEIYEGLEEIKDQLTALIDEYEEEETHTGKADELIEALDALEDASETIEMCWKINEGESIFSPARAV